MVLSNTKQLTSLMLIRTQVSEIAAIRNLSELTDLVLGGSPVNDAGLANLRGLAKLRRLNLNGSQVTESGVQQLKRALPNLTIER